MSLLQFPFIQQSDSGKTNIYGVRCNAAYLGAVKWFGRWRKYCFFPNGEAIFDTNCLTEIASFCQQETAKHNHK
jgi:hypothetical protein